MKAVTAQETQQIESAWFATGAMSIERLMDDVGRKIAEWVIARVPRPISLCNIALLAGKGNNGGDAIVAATYLAERGANATVLICLPREPDDPLLKTALERGVAVVDASGTQELSEVAALCRRSDLVVDGVFGFSLSRPIDARLGEMLAAVRSASRFIAAIDLPSGADADSGAFDPNGLPADATLSVGATKLGTAIRFGSPEFGREHHLIDVAMPSKLSNHISREIVSDELAAKILPTRSPTAHKGSHGRTLLIVGSAAYPGAAILSTNACARSSVGLLTVAVPPSIKSALAVSVPEATFLDLPVDSAGQLHPDLGFERLSSAIRGVDSVLIGCGLGISDVNRRLLELLFASGDLWRGKTVVADADALTMAAGTDLFECLNGDLIVTPHPGEMARLLGTDIDDVESDRLRAAHRAAAMLNGVTVSKGAATLIADPSERVRLNMRPNAGLARGGSGDVLAGLIAGLAAQMHPFDAATLGVYLHSVAGELAASQFGEHGVTASDVASSLPTAFRRLPSLNV